MNFYENQLADAAAALGKAFRTAVDLEAKQVDQNKNRVDHAKLHRIEASSQPPRDCHHH